MDRTEAFRRLSDVVNLTDGVATAERVAEDVDYKIVKAQEQLDAAKAAKRKAEASLEAERARLADAQALLAEVPGDLVDEVAADVGSKRATRERYLAALADAGDDSDAVAEVREAAAAAGVVTAQAGVASGTAESMGVG